MKDFSYILTTNSISIDFEDSYFVVNSEDSKKFNNIKKLIKAEKYSEIVEILMPAKKVMVYANNYFSIDENGGLYMSDKLNEKVPVIISNKLMDFVEEDLPIEPLIKFWKKLRENPSDDSKLDLYAFLEQNNHPITPEGNFIAYKKVTSATKNGKSILVDSHSRTIDNSVGTTPTMKRASVDSNRNSTCSTGLHVAAMNYAKGFSGDTMIKVSVDPSDVVAVPIDYNREKMRVCKYSVVAIMNNNKSKSTNKQILDKIPKSKDLNKIDLKKSDDTSMKTKVSLGKSSYKERPFVDLSKLTAREIVDKTHRDIKIKINVSLKNKQTIVKKAKKYYEMKLWTVKI